MGEMAIRRCSMPGRESLDGPMNRRDFLAVTARATVGFSLFGLWIVTLDEAEAATDFRQPSAFSPAFGTGFR